MHSLRYLKRHLFKLGMFFSLFISFLVLIILLTSIAYKGTKALQTHYISLKNTNLYQVDYTKIKNILDKTFIAHRILNYNMSLFELQNATISKNEILIPVQKASLPPSVLLKLEKNDLINTKWDFSFFKNPDSSSAKNAGIFSSLIGSLFTLLICIMFSVPLGIGTAIYLEEFAPKNKITGFIEVNIKNLAAIPSIVYGLLSLVFFIKVIQIKRSSSLVGGLTLAMMSIPIIMTITQQALRSVPYRIREGALALGTSKIQLLFKFIMPISFPTIITGIVLAISRVIGETAPLIIVGMAAFVTKSPSTFFDPTTTLPTQIYLWSDNIDKLFIEKSCLAILVLLFTLFVINFIALYFKSRSSQYAK